MKAYFEKCELSS